MVHGENIMVKFTALQNAKVLESKVPKPQNEALDEALRDALEMKLLCILKSNPYITQNDVVKLLSTSRATVQRLMKVLTIQGKIERIGDKCYGYWKIYE